MKEIKVYFETSDLEMIQAAAGDEALSTYIRRTVLAELRRHPPKAIQSPRDAPREEIRSVLREELLHAIPARGIGIEGKEEVTRARER